MGKTTIEDWNKLTKIMQRKKRAAQVRVMITNLLIYIALLCFAVGLFLHAFFELAIGMKITAISSAVLALLFIALSKRKRRHR